MSPISKEVHLADSNATITARRVIKTDPIFISIQLIFPNEY